MSYILAGILILLLMLAVVTSKGDIFAPETMMTAAFLFSTICSIYQLSIWDYQVSTGSVVIITSALLVAILFGLLTRGIMRQGNGSRTLDITGEHISPIPRWASIFSLLIVCLTCVATAYQIVRIGGTGKLTDVMASYRTQTAYGTDLEDKLPGWVSQLQNVVSVIGYIYIYNILCFGKNLRVSERFIDIMVIALSCIANMMTGGRFGTLCMAIGGMMMYWILRYRGGESSGAKLSTVLKILAIVIMTLATFYLVKDLVGRESDYDLVDYLTHYAGGGIVGFDMYLQNPPVPSDIFGKETFYSLINGLRKLGVIDVPYYAIHHEFRISNGTSIGNIYTALRDYNYDFGLVGMIVLHIVFCCFMCLFYEHAKKRGTGFETITLAMVYYCVPMYSISNTFYSNIVSFGFLIKLVELYILYRLFFVKKDSREKASLVQPIKRRALLGGNAR